LFLSLVLLWFFTLLFDHSLLLQIGGFLNSGHLPDFTACARLVAYLIAGFATAKLIHKNYPGWMIFCAFPLSAFLAVLWLQAMNA
jgi:hypothetical protein